MGGDKPPRLAILVSHTVAPLALVSIVIEEKPAGPLLREMQENLAGAIKRRQEEEAAKQEAARRKEEARLANAESTWSSCVERIRQEVQQEIGRSGFDRSSVEVSVLKIQPGDYPGNHYYGVYGKDARLSKDNLKGVALYVWRQLESQGFKPYLSYELESTDRRRRHDSGLVPFINVRVDLANWS